MSRTIESPAKCGMCAVIQILYSEQAMRNVVVHDNARPHTAAATKKLEAVFIPPLFSLRYFVHANLAKLKHIVIISL